MKRKIMFTFAMLCGLACVLWLQPPSYVIASKPDEETKIAIIDFFGYGQLDVMKLRSALPIKPGESIERSQWSRYRSRIEDAIRSATGNPPTDVAAVCCDEHGSSI